MKTKLALLALAITVAFSGYIAFHPGIAYAQPAYATSAHQTSLTQAGSYTADVNHTVLGFQVRHLGINDIQGRFNKHTGHLLVDPKNITKSSVQFTIETSSIDTGVAPRDAHLRTADFFEVEKYPAITFQSTRIRKSGGGYIADGNLTIKNVTKKIAIPFKVYGPITDPWKSTRIGVVASPIKINRQDYGIAYNDKLPDGTPAVGNEVTIQLSFEATLDKAAN